MIDSEADIAKLDAANADLHGEIRTLREQIEAQGETLARTLADHEAVVAELTRERDSARDIAVRCGAFDGSAGTDFPAHLDRTWEMAPVDPEGQAFK